MPCQLVWLNCTNKIKKLSKLFTNSTKHDIIIRRAAAIGFISFGAFVPVQLHILKYYKVFCNENYNSLCNERIVIITYKITKTRA